ncbi:hypothetical protein JOD63_003154 [Microbacterium terrae]|uniref:Uncharacterized protein n=1 Tax=Microbacterium terrae TaxID=69369 RepID=A0A0M2H8M6_9MICO|nr:hypothetical protein [Microbacterium terrae]KJL40489.1 hypothetical protein RS81_01573 [Microbacterium terrae]MBP1079186.1 hypothetical protein [Microbacterium terrae]
MTEVEQGLVYALAIVSLLGSLTVVIWQLWRQRGRRGDRDDR